MTIFQSVILGFVQGSTEFLPISSTGHLMLVQAWMHLSPEHLAGFDIMLHAGTLAALVLCYPRDWYRILRSPFVGDRQYQRLLLLLIIATIPGALIGALFADVIQTAMGSMRWLGVEFLVNAALLVIAERFRATRTRSDVRIVDAVLLGCAQALALSPALSRSALTISAGRMLGLSRSDALNISFLMATPIIAGASLFTAFDILSGSVAIPPLSITIPGILTALVSSVAAILFLRHFVARHSLLWFALYLVIIGLLLCGGL